MFRILIENVVRAICLLPSVRFVETHPLTIFINNQVNRVDYLKTHTCSWIVSNSLSLASAEKDSTHQLCLGL